MLTDIERIVNTLYSRKYLANQRVKYELSNTHEKSTNPNPSALISDHDQPNPSALDSHHDLPYPSVLISNHDLPNPSVLISDHDLSNSKDLILNPDVPFMDDESEKMELNGDKTISMTRREDLNNTDGMRKKNELMNDDGEDARIKIKVERMDEEEEEEDEQEYPDTTKKDELHIQVPVFQ